MANNTPCIRCGKPRIIAKSWSEYIGVSLVTFTETVCPDPECQKIVDDQLQKKKEKIENIHKESLKRRGNIKRVKKVRK